jgi:hypothetical protein
LIIFANQRNRGKILTASIFFVWDEVYKKLTGPHLSGMDINSSLGRISNKSAKYSKKNKKHRYKFLQINHGV